MLTLTVNTEYTTIRPAPLTLAQALSDHLSYLSPRATPYNIAFASGQWDGMMRMYERIYSRFPTGLLQKVKRFLDKMNVEYKVVSELPDLPQSVEMVYRPKWSLRPYQQEAVDTAFNRRRGVIHIPTGGGKTEVAQAIINRVGAPRVVFLVPSRALLFQTAKRMTEVFPGSTIIQWGDGKKPPDRVPAEYILVATVQSAFKEAHPLLQQAEIVFVDESHHQSAETFQRATRCCKRARYLFGLSATPYRADGTDMELEAWVGPIIYSVDYEHLISNGWLVEPEFHRVMTLEEGMELTRGKKTLVFSEKTEDLYAIERYLTDRRASILTGKHSTKMRNEVLDRLRNGEITHIAATPLFDEGLDIPDIDAVFFYSTCGSRVKAIQRIGRAMRPAPGKTKCLVVDLLDEKFDDRMKAYMREPAFAARIHTGRKFRSV